MSDGEPADALAGVREVRVHGVGGPQARKILGVLDETDTETVRLPLPPGQRGLFADPKSRLVRRVEGPEVVAYEWGGLTLGSLLNALWVVYLPLTFLNVAGWSGRPQAGRRNRAVVHLLCALGTLTYIAWIGYLLLDVVGRQWRDRLLDAKLPDPALWALRNLGLPAAHVLFAGVLAALWFVNRRSGACFEGVTTGEAAASWDEQGQVVDPGFFGHARSYERLRSRHEWLALPAALAVVALGFVPRHLESAPAAPLTSIGLAIVALIVVQGLLLLGMWAACRWAGSVPQAVFATVGTVLCHAAFAGVAITAGARLSRWPRIETARPVVAGPELGFDDFFFLALLLAVLSCVAFGLRIHFRGGGAAGYDRPRRLKTALVSSANAMGALVSLSFACLLVVVIALQYPDLHLQPAHPLRWWGSVIRWYGGYRSRQNAAQKLGGLALAALALGAVAVLRRPRQGGLARVLGNVWDVLTFWPRRFHPFAVPPYAERAVPELRSTLHHLRNPDAPLVVLGHSQGSVLAFTAVSEELAARPEGGPVSLLTFGSPLGVLLDHAFPAYFDGPTRRSVAGRIKAAGGRWWNVYRSTDPIGGPVGASEARTDHWFDKWLPDPRRAAVANPVPVPPPLERARPWGSVDGHNFYLADPTVRRMVGWLHSGSPVTSAELEAEGAE